MKEKSALYRLTLNSGELVILAKNIFLAFYNFAKRKNLILKNFIIMGIETLPITLIMSFFVGSVLALQTGYQLDKFNLTDFLGSIVGLSLLKELAPVQTAVLIAGKVGSAITAELGTMQVSEEIDGLKIMGIDVYNYLIFPKFIACIISTVVLVIYTDFVGFIGGALVSKSFYNVSYEKFFNSFVNFANNIDFVSNIVKSLAFGFLIALISCHFGLKTKGGAEEVGRSTTKTVVVSFIVILFTDFIITKVLMYFA